MDGNYLWRWVSSAWKSTGYKNWSLLQKHAKPTPGTDLPTTPPAQPAFALGSRDRHYLHGDQHVDQPTKFYCRSCDYFVDDSHFFAEHDRKETLRRALDAINRWNGRDPKRLPFRPLGASNMLEVQARAQAAAHEASRSPFHRWLERQKARKGPTGDIARDILGDEGFPVTVTTYDTAEKYLHSRFACNDAVKALKGAWRSFRAAQSRQQKSGALPPSLPIQRATV